LLQIIAQLLNNSNTLQADQDMKLVTISRLQSEPGWLTWK